MDLTSHSADDVLRVDVSVAALKALLAAEMDFDAATYLHTVLDPDFRRWMRSADACESDAQLREACEVILDCASGAQLTSALRKLVAKQPDNSESDFRSCAMDADVASWMHLVGRETDPRFQTACARLLHCQCEDTCNGAPLSPACIPAFRSSSSQAPHAQKSDGLKDLSKAPSLTTPQQLRGDAILANEVNAWRDSSYRSAELRHEAHAVAFQSMREHVRRAAVACVMPASEIRNNLVEALQQLPPYAHSAACDLAASAPTQGRKSPLISMPSAAAVKLFANNVPQSAAFGLGIAAFEMFTVGEETLRMLAGDLSCQGAGALLATGLTELQIHHHPAASVQALARALAALTSLRSLDIFNVKDGAAQSDGSAYKAPHLQASRMAALAPSLRKLTGLRHLGLPQQRIADRGALLLAGALGTWPRLTSLDVAGSDLSDTGVKQLASALAGCSELRALDISRNALLGAQGMTSLAGVLAACPGLTALNVSRSNVFGPAGKKALSAVLRASTRLASLDISDLGTDQQGAAWLTTTLTALARLTSLKLGGNEFQAARTAKLAPALASLSQLADLHLDRCCLGDEGAAALASSLRGLRSLVVLDLSSNDIRDAGAQSLDRLVAALSTLTKLDLSGNAIRTLPPVLSSAVAEVGYFRSRARKLHIHVNLHGPKP